MTYNFVLVCCILNKQLVMFFSGKIVNSLPKIFTMEKALVKIIFWYNFSFSFVHRFSKKCGTFLGLLECKKMI